MAIDNNFYKIRGTELGEIQVALATVAKGNMPTQEDADAVLGYVQEAFRQPAEKG